jgi:hypothetical protein
VSTHTYYMDDCTIVVPPGFVDQTLNALNWTIDGEERIGLVVQRETLSPADLSGADALDRYVARQTRGYPAQFSGFQIERDDTAGGDQGFEMRRKTFRWRHELGVLYHHQVYVRAGDAVLTLTGSAKARYREAVDRVVDEAVAGLRIRGEDDRT